MIVDKDAAFGDIIWTPDQETIDASSVKHFVDFLGDHDINLNATYDDLWHWSVDEPELFWSLFAEFAGVQLGGVTGPVCSTDLMPHTQWFLSLIHI